MSGDVDELLAVLAGVGGPSPLGKPSFVLEHDGPVRGLWFGPRRYMLWRDTPDGRQLVKATEGHLGGVYADPTGTAARLDDGRHQWSAQLVDALIDAAVAFDHRRGFHPTFPAFARRMAVRRLRVTSRRELDRLRAAGLDLDPFSTYLRAEPWDWGSPIVPVGADHDNPDRWVNGPWVDQRTATPIGELVTDLVRLRRGQLRVRTIAEVAVAWATGDDPTTIPADPGDFPAFERGRRLPKPIRSTAALVSLVGSEGRRLTGRLANPDAEPADLQAIYTDPDPWPAARQLLHTVGSAAITQQSGLPGRTVRAALNTKRPPSDATRRVLVGVALDLADQLLGDRAPSDPIAKLGAGVVCLGGAGLQVCACGCGTPLAGRRTRWHSDAHRMRAARRTVQR